MLIYVRRAMLCFLHDCAGKAIRMHPLLALACDKRWLKGAVIYHKLSSVYCSVFANNESRIILSS